MKTLVSTIIYGLGIFFITIFFLTNDYFYLSMGLIPGFLSGLAHSGIFNGEIEI